ncbi:MAG: PKD domain-containing protein [Chitinophagaceae bacterium]|nr:MAG: PKD domain-containing protein [Chitinophagaceae bacterium]
MRKIYLLLACFFYSLFTQAQTSINQVNFTFVSDPLTNNITFTNTSVLQGDGIRKAYWYFGDGGSAVTAPLSGAVHHYNATGTYQVCLKIYKYNPNNLADSILLGSECKSVLLEQHCNAGFQWADSVVTNPLAHYLKLYGSGSNNANKVIKAVCWNFGDGTDTCILATPGTTPPLNIVHKYTQSGTYNVCIRVTFDGGCVAEKCNSIKLNAPVVADSCAANYTIQNILVTRLGRKFIAQPWHSNNKKPVRICWTFGDGKDTCIQYATSYSGDYWVEHKYAQYGQYEVCVIIKYDGGCEKRKCNPVVIASPMPPADTCTLDLSETTANPANLERKFYVGLMQNRRAEKICWTFGDGTDTCVILNNPVSPLQLMVVHHYPAPGNYTICAKVYYAGGCTAQRCKPVVISVPQSNVCGGYFADSLISTNTFRFKGNGIHNPTDYVTSYNWTFGDGTSAAGQVTTHSYASAGRYSVCLTIRTNSGCETRICKPVAAAGNVQPQLVLTPNPVVNVLNAMFISQFQQMVTVKIYNASGVAIRSTSYTLPHWFLSTCQKRLNFQ